MKNPMPNPKEIENEIKRIERERIKEMLRKN